MNTNMFLRQLAQRLNGDRKAMNQAQEILRAMIDRKLWKQMQSPIDLPSDIGQIESLLDRYNIFFRDITLTSYFDLVSRTILSPIRRQVKS